MNINSKTYDLLKAVAQYLLPALGTLYFALSGIWGLPYGEQIVGTITAIDTFLGVLIGISTAQYNKVQATSIEQPVVPGPTVVEETPAEPVVSTEQPANSTETPVQ